MAAAPAPEQLHSLYTALDQAIQDLSGRSLAEVEQELVEVRALGRQLREVSVVIEETERALFEAVTRLRGGSNDPILRGRRLMLVALEQLRAAGPMHYRDLFDQIEDAGHCVGGKDSLATLLTSLSRAPEIEKLGRGVYQAKGDPA